MTRTANKSERLWMQLTFSALVISLVFSAVTVFSMCFGRAALVAEVVDQRVALDGLAQRVAALEAKQAPTQRPQLPSGAE